ncbi:MAG: PASTA domain-containing protein, partial [Eubacterium sp.]|nr:PASTA domain-containing protein [Eubacterium sp.]
YCAVHFSKGGNDTPETSAPPVADTAKVPVPDFCKAGYTEAEIKNQASWNSQFTITFKSDFSKDVEEGLVFEQSVKAGEEVAKGAAIVLTVSKGIETVAVQDVGGLAKDDAIKKLEEDGFKVNVVTIYNDDNDTPNTVRKRNGMAPAAGEEIAKGEEVVIQVYGETVTEPTDE